MSNLRFPKVFVLTNVGTQLITDNTKRPHQLTSGQVGLFNVDGFEIIGVGIGATPATSVPAIQIHQNIGDNEYGTVRTKTIKRDDVVAYYSQAASTSQTDIHYIGYDGVDVTKGITVPKATSLQFHVHIWDKALAKWYGHNPGFNKTITVYTGDGTGTADQDFVADALVAAFNNTVQPANDYKVQSELTNYLTASKVTTGTPGTGGYKVGVKIETKALSPELLNNADPIKFYEVKLVTLDVSYIANIPGYTVPVTNTQKATSGSGFPAELAALEAESQGYDRVREVFSEPRYMKLSNYVIKAADGQKYDYVYLQYKWSHNQGGRGSSTAQITEPYEVIFAAPTGTLQPLAAVLNSWLTGKFPAVTI